MNPKKTKRKSPAYILDVVTKFKGVISPPYRTC
nr:MAG TPA: hypothetical protein [Caudoviricetes sp.]